MLGPGREARAKERKRQAREKELAASPQLKQVTAPVRPVDGDFLARLEDAEQHDKVRLSGEGQRPKGMYACRQLPTWGT